MVGVMALTAQRHLVMQVRSMGQLFRAVSEHADDGPIAGKATLPMQIHHF